MSKHTPGPWHVNAIDSKRNRIVGDETSTGWDKIQINSANNTIATVYHAADARLIAEAPHLLAMCKLALLVHETVGAAHSNMDPGQAAQIRGAIARAEGGK